MSRLRTGLAVVTAGVLASTAFTGAPAAAKSDSHRPDSRDTRAVYTPGQRFTPLPTSVTCTPTAGRSLALPSGYRQSVLVEEGEGGTTDLFDMQTQNESGRDAGRYLYRTHETGTASAVSVTDLHTGNTSVLAQRADWERFDGIVWTPHGTLLAAEETSEQAARDPQVPEAVGGLVYELFPDPRDPGRLRLDDPRDTVAPFNDGVAARPALGAKSHEGMRFDREGNHYGISETAPGGIFRFVPAARGDLSEGTLQVLRTENGRTGAGAWVTIPDAQAEVNAQTAAVALGGNGYSRPEDVETGTSTGRDANNRGNTLYVAITGSDEVIAVDLSGADRPVAYQYIGASEAANAPADFDAPDNLALDSRGNLAVTEDPGGTPPAKTVGDDIWIAAPPAQGGHRPAEPVGRFASIRDCAAEPTGIYFAMAATQRFTAGGPFAGAVTDHSLLVNRQHAGQGTTIDQLIAITPNRS
jgi:hypothetical protein